MILVGQYDSPYTRRVAVSLGLLGFVFEHDKRSVFGDFDSMRTGVMDFDSFDVKLMRNGMASHAARMARKTLADAGR